MAGLVLFFFSMRFKKPSSNLKWVNKANIPVHERLTTGIVIIRVKMTLYSGNDHSKLALRRQQGLTENNLWISVSYNIGEGGGGGFTNNIITYVNKSGTEITRIMIMITKTLKLMVAATEMIINISFCCCDKDQESSNDKNGRLWGLNFSKKYHY